MIAIVTDSTCDIPGELVDRHRINVIPALINIDEKTLRDGIDISRERFYKLLPEMPRLPTTSAPGPSAFLDAYDNMLEWASDVISVHAASRLSGIYNAARLAAKEIAPERIHIIDTGQISMGVGWAALAAAEAIEKSMPLEGVLHSVEDTIVRTRVFALLNTVEYLAKSGRVNMLQAGLSNLLNIKPIVELRDGVVNSAARVRTWSRAVGKLARRMRESGPIDRLAVMHSNCIDCATSFMDVVRDVIPPPESTLITNATTVIGTHVGPHALGFAAVTKKNK